MSIGELNLARKWRSTSFDHVIGQELSVRMLKNSLYRDQFFPVYLFSGQRGCGKTSTARIFSASVNCEKLPLFQQNPKLTAIPCLTCSSCDAMRVGRHPDFFEIDAASHTGVDTIRQLIDSSQLLPVMGRKKIYLIDEAHMLSKASFNALLKILEEPPRSVLFILATTDVHKIIDTVRSRCFQLFFGAISSDHVYTHLAHVCEQEGISADEQGLRCIADHADGSLRDALNLLEQVRFSTSKITKQAVFTVLGYLDDEHLVTLFEKLCVSTPHDLLSYMQEIRLESYSAERVWERLLGIARAALWIKHGVQPQQLHQYEARIKHSVATCTWASLIGLCDRLHDEQVVFNRTTVKYALLEMILLQACYGNRGNGGTTGGAAAQVISGTQVASDHTVCADSEGTVEQGGDEHENEVQDQDAPALWTRFVHDVGRLGDPLLKSVFQQARCRDYHNAIVTVELSKKFFFFQDWLTDTHDAWAPILRGVFGKNASLKVDFVDGIASVKPDMLQVPMSTRKRELTLDTKKQGTLAHTLVRHCPGTLAEIGELVHG